MKIKIELSDSEVKAVISDKIREKYPDLKFYNDHLVFNGSVKVSRRGKKVRKDFNRISVSIETNQGI